MGESKPDPLTRAFIEKVEFKATERAGVPGLSVTADFGERRMKPEEVPICLSDQNVVKFLPVTRRYHIDFVFDGHNYKVAPGSTAAARVFGH